MGGPSFLALIVQGPRSGERITVAADPNGDLPEVIELPDRVVLTSNDHTATDDAPSTARYTLTGHDARRNAYIYVHVVS